MSCAYIRNPLTQYLAAPCCPTSRPVVEYCTTSCPVGNWLCGTCTENATGVCMNCNTYKRGYRRDSDCWSVVDATWTPCGVNVVTGVFPPGFYCDGFGAQTQCPNNLTADMYADAANQCYCPAGTISNTDGMTCSPKWCGDAARSLVAPGAGWTSSYYMALNAAHSSTDCLPCGGPSFSVGDGVGPASCIYPANYYRADRRRHAVDDIIVRRRLSHRVQ
jgi:hypothetical protein